MIVVIKKTTRFGLFAGLRIIDEGAAAAFLQSLKERLENPALTFSHLEGNLDDCRSFCPYVRNYCLTLKRVFIKNSYQISNEKE